MSDECGDNTPSSLAPSSLSCPTHCYWYSQGKCFLNILPEHDVYQIICQSPVARDAVSECVDRGCCEAPSSRIMHVVESEGTIRDRKDLSDDFQRRINTPYRDNSPYIGPGVFRDPSGDDS